MGTLKFRSVEHQTVRLVGVEKTMQLLNVYLLLLVMFALFFFFLFSLKIPEMQKCKIEANVIER